MTPSTNNPKFTEEDIKREQEMFFFFLFDLVRFTCRINLEQIKRIYIQYSTNGLQLDGESWLKFIECRELQEWLHLQALLIRKTYTYYSATARFRNYIMCPASCAEYPTARYIVKIEDGALETYDDGVHGTTVATICSFFIFRLFFPDREFMIFMDEKPHTINSGLEIQPI